MKHQNIGTTALSFYQDAGLFDKILVWGRPHICPLEPILNWVQPGSTVLDIGCGSGLLLFTLAINNLVDTGSGIDKSDKSIEIARKANNRFAANNKNITISFFKNADISDITVDQFDIVLLIDVIHHIPKDHQLQFLNNVFRKVRPGGRLIYKDMANKPYIYAAFNMLHDLILSRQLIRYLPIANAQNYFESLGGTTLTRQAWRRGFYAHEMLVIEK